MPPEVMENILEMSGRIEVLKKEAGIIKKKINDNFRTEKYNNGIYKKHI